MPYKNPEDKRRYQREWVRQRRIETGHSYLKGLRQRRKAMVREAKEGKPCADCGVVYPHYVMDFDHRPGETKLLDVGDMVNFFGFKKLLEEMAKCDLVCANCHRERTYQRRMASVAGTDGGSNPPDAPKSMASHDGVMAREP